jgi:lipid-A-disaccharide synthase-like uncharacterized protein
MTANHLWIALGFTGQLLFMSRWLVQWISSERVQRSVVPLAFWYLSLAGSSTLLIYAIHLGDPVFIAGHLANSAIYLRNLSLLLREARA